MLNKYFGPKTHLYVQLFGLSVLAVGIPLSKALMSIGALLGVINLLLMGDYRQISQRLRSNRFFLLILAFFLLHVIALLWSNNLEYGLNDLRKKLPLLVVPLALAGGPKLQAAQQRLVLLLFLLATFFASVYNFFSFQSEIDRVTDFRLMSNFGSHIRFSLMVAISILIALYFYKSWKKFAGLFLLFAIWLCIYTYYSQVLSGFIALFGALYFYLIYWFWSKPLIRWAMLLIPLFLLGLVLVYIHSLPLAERTQAKHGQEILNFTREGNTYDSDSLNLSTENGYYIYRNISPLEIDREWAKRSDVPIDFRLHPNLTARVALIRYLSSKGLNKDAEGMAMLSAGDIKNIEKGYTSELNAKSGITGRLATFRFQLENKANPNGSSLLQRIHYWKTGVKVYFSSPFIGVGTGDVQDAFIESYISSESPMNEEYRLRAHNSYLTFILTFGPFGLFLFLAIIYIYLNGQIRSKNSLAFMIFGVILFSFFSEDTLETQAGVSLFALFVALYLPQKRESRLR
jgi:MFS family permease